MAREIMTAADVKARGLAAAPPSPQQQPDGYQEKLLKYIPADVIMLYVTLDTIVKQAGGTAPHGAAQGIFWVGLCFTPLYLWRAAKISKAVQLAISTGAFAVWVLGLRNPPFDNWNPFWGTVILPIYTFLVPLIDP